MLITPEEITAADRRRQDFDDLMVELAGGSWKIPRFLTKAQIERIRERAGRDSSDSIAGMTWREYLELFTRIRNRLDVINRAIEKALVKSERRLKEAREALEDVRRRATVDGQGRKVYRTADRSRAFTDDGKELTAEEKASIKWDRTAPTWEERVGVGEKWKQAEQAHEEILRYKERADYYTERMVSGDILSRDELDTIRQDLDAMPQAVRAEVPGRMAEARTAPLSEAFSLSATELAGITPEPPTLPAGPDLSPHP